MSNPIWLGKEVTIKGALLFLFMLLIYLPMHEFGHWFGYWICGIPSHFKIIYDPIFAIAVTWEIEPSWPVHLFTSFFGGGFVFIICLIISIKVRPVFIVSVVGLFGGITELTYNVLFYGNVINTIASSMMLYIALQTVPMIIVFVIGTQEFKSWIRHIQCRHPRHRISDHY